MSEIDRLMDKFAKDYDDADIDAIIAYVRKQLAMYDQGIKPKKEAENIDAQDIMRIMAETRGKAPPVAKPVQKSKLRRI